jgi:sirohydrochlorin ferrochelatase
VSTAPALLACSHGTSSPAGQRSVAALVDAVAERRPRILVRGGFVDVQQPDVESSLDALDPAQPVAIVPLLLSAGYHVHVDLAEAAAAAAPRQVSVTGALGPDVRLARILAARLDIAGLRPTDHVVLAAAGSSDANAVRDCERMGELLAAEIGRPVTVSFVSAAKPRVPVAVLAAREAAGADRVVVSTFLLAPGYFADLARQMALSAGAAMVSDPILVDGDRPPAALVDIVCDLYDSVAVPASASASALAPRV